MRRDTLPIYLNMPNKNSSIQTRRKNTDSSFATNGKLQKKVSLIKIIVRKLQAMTCISVQENIILGTAK